MATPIVPTSVTPSPQTIANQQAQNANMARYLENYYNNMFAQQEGNRQEYGRWAQASLDNLYAQNQGLRQDQTNVNQENYNRFLNTRGADGPAKLAEYTGDFEENLFQDVSGIYEGAKTPDQLRQEASGIMGQNQAGSQGGSNTLTQLYQGDDLNERLSALAPVNQQRIAGVEAQKEAIELGLQQSLAQQQAQMAQRGLGSSSFDAARMGQGTVAARQAQEQARQQALLANAEAEAGLRIGDRDLRLANIGKSEQLTAAQLALLQAQENAPYAGVDALNERLGLFDLGVGQAPMADTANQFQTPLLRGYATEGGATLIPQIDPQLLNALLNSEVATQNSQIDDIANQGGTGGTNTGGTGSTGGTFVPPTGLDNVPGVGTGSGGTGSGTGTGNTGTGTNTGGTGSTGSGSGPGANAGYGFGTTASGSTVLTSPTGNTAEAINSYIAGGGLNPNTGSISNPVLQSSGRTILSEALLSSGSSLTPEQREATLQLFTPIAQSLADGAKNYLDNRATGNSMGALASGLEFLNNPNRTNDTSINQLTGSLLGEEYQAGWNSLGTSLNPLIQANQLGLFTPETDFSNPVIFNDASMSLASALRSTYGSGPAPGSKLPKPGLNELYALGLSDSFINSLQDPTNLTRFNGDLDYFGIAPLTSADIADFFAQQEGQWYDDDTKIGMDSSGEYYEVINGVETPLPITDSRHPNYVPPETTTEDDTGDEVLPESDLPNPFDEDGDGDL